MKKQKVIVICGPTGTGKTETALKIAKKINGSLVNADSTQVYNGVDIGTNKGEIDYSIVEYFNLGTNELALSRLPVHKFSDINAYLFSFLSPDKQINLFGWRNLAFQSIKHIVSESKIPILVGGTGLYIDSIVRNYVETNEKIDLELRSNLREMGLEQLHVLMQDLNPLWRNDFNQSDVVNKARLIRYIEKKKAQDLADINRIVNITASLSNKFDLILLYPEFVSELVKSSLLKRAELMVSDKFFTEVESLIQNFGENSPVFKIMGYSEVKNFLKNEINLEECKAQIFRKHWQYFRRQRTWFEGKGRNYDLIRYKNSEEAITLAEKFLAE